MTTIIMRYPCLMEDEGRHFFIAAYDNKEDALAWIADQKDEYFRPSDYYILEKNNDQTTRSSRNRK